MAPTEQSSTPAVTSSVSDPVPAAGMKIHPLAELFPQMEGQEFEDLVEAIRQHGQVEPVVLLHGKDDSEEPTLLDGRNRQRACERLGIETKYTDFELLGQTCIPEQYIWDKNVQRRHLTDDQRAELVLAWKPHLEEEARKRMAAGGGDRKSQDARKSGVAISPDPIPDAGRTRHKLAEKAGVSDHKMRLAEDIEADPELRKEVRTGKAKLAAASKRAKAKTSREPVSASVKKACGNKSDAWRMTFRTHWDHGTAKDHAWAIRVYLKREVITVQATESKAAGKKPTGKKKKKRRTAPRKRVSHSRAARCADATERLDKVAAEARDIADCLTGKEQTVEGLRKIQTRIRGLEVSALVEELEDLKEGIETWRDNMPENLQGGDMYSTLDETANILDNAVSELSGLNPPGFPLPEKDADVHVGAIKLDGLVAALREYADAIEGQTGELENAELPGMMG
jgi:ParB-like chromosome segregation protein Spo0J